MTIIFVLFVIIVAEINNCVCQDAATTPNTTEALLTGIRSEDKFLYFAYGSNLLAGRIHINNPTAVRVSAAKLTNHRLDFGYWSQRWKGAAATVVPDETEHVWGAVWELDRSDMDHLDRQEGVEAGIYYPFPVEVVNPSGEILHCRCYQLCDTPVKLLPGEPVTDDRLPSELYMSVIIKGAEESNIPNYYIDQLKKVPHNSYKGDNSTTLGSLVSG